METKTKLCKHCQTEIPKKAKVCPNCRKKQSSKLKTVGIVFLVLCILGAIGNTGNNQDSVESNTPKPTATPKPTQTVKATNTPTPTLAPTPTTDPVKTEEEYKSSCKEYKYKDVLRNPEEYIGKRVKITVKISSVHEKTWLNSTKYYMAYSQSDYGWYGDRYGVFDLREEQEPKLLKDDIITVYGEITDPEYTKSLIVNGAETFCIEMKYIDFIEE